MATLIREALNADSMKLRMYTGGMTYAGFNLSGTWVGTITFRGSYDGVNFVDISVTPFASGTDVSSSTANGSWFVAVKNLLVVEASFSRTSGTALVTIGASVDSSYQDAFLASTSIYVESQSASTNTLTQAASTNRAWKLEELIVSIAGPSWAGGTVQLTVYDGSTSGSILYKTFIDEVAGSVGRRYTLALPAAGIVNTVGNAMTIVLFGTGSTQTSILNAKFSAA